tara:strand:+ start:32 stop:1159 length:1128 start_codon:yes stop_codon:yes gene_type:complete
MGKSKQIATMLTDAPAALDTLDELAAALGDDANFATTVTNSIATKLDISNPVIDMGTNKKIEFIGNIGEIGSVPGFQARNDAGTGLRSMGLRGTSLRFATGSDERVRIEDTGVGIGTTSPDRALHIEGSDFASSSIRLKRSGGGTNNDAGLQFQSAAGANDGHGMGGIWFQNSLDGNAYALMRARTDDSTGTSGRFEFMTNTAGNPVNNFTTPRMTIHNDGAVSMPSQPVGYRRNTHTGNGWITLTNGGAHNIFNSWYTPSAYQQHITADSIDNSGRYYAPQTGWYMVNPEIYATTGSVTSGVYGYANVYKNGSNQFGGHIINYGGDTNDKMNSHSVLVYMTDTDYIQIGVYVSGSGGAFQVYSPYCGYWVRFLG